MNSPFALFKWQALFQDWTVFAEGFGVTLLTSILALSLSILLGCVFGVLGTAEGKAAKSTSRVYVEFIQNTPLMIQVFILYHGLPHLGIVLPVFPLGVLAVGVYHGAYIAEVVRAGIESIPKGQKEAAVSQGFTFWEAMYYIILPQAKKVIYPPLTNQAVNLIKNTSILAVVAGGDLLYHADSWSSNNLYYGPAYMITGVLYFLLCFPLAKFARQLELREVAKA